MEGNLKRFFFTGISVKFRVRMILERIILKKIVFFNYKKIIFYLFHLTKKYFDF